jgi:predicted SnoaL-like aldol condensation-catalyzing enzyme
MNTLTWRHLAVALILALATPAAASSDELHTRDVATQLVNTFVQALNTDNVALLDRVFPENYVQHNPQVGQGRAAVEKFFDQQLRYVRSHHIGIHISAESIAVDGDLVVARLMMTLDRHGKLSYSRSLDEWRLENGMLAEHWDADTQEYPKLH